MSLMETVEASLNSLNATVKELSIRNVDEFCKIAKALKDVVSCFRAFYDLFSERPGTLSTKNYSFPQETKCLLTGKTQPNLTKTRHEQWFKHPKLFLG